MNDNKERFAGSCLCGAVTFEGEADISGFYFCHCSRCQKASGSAHSASLFVKDAKLTWQTGQDLLTSYQVPDSRNARSFCRCCGSPMPHYHQAIGQWQLPAGCLDTKITRQPDAQFFLSSLPGWSLLRPEIPGFDRLPE